MAENGDGRKKIGHRPSLLTVEVQGQIVTRIVAGNTLTDATESMGIHEATAQLWMQKGRENLPGPDAADTTYVSFYDAIKKARAECRVRLVIVLRNAAEGPMVKHHMKGGCPLTNGLAPTCACPTERMPANPFIAARMLESLDPQHWLRTERREITGAGGGPIEEESPAARISESADRIAARLLSQVVEKNGA